MNDATTRLIFLTGHLVFVFGGIEEQQGIFYFTHLICLFLCILNRSFI
jgi:hypothetical protein